VGRPDIFRAAVMMSAPFAGPPSFAQASKTAVAKDTRAVLWSARGAQLRRPSTGAPPAAAALLMASEVDMRATRGTASFPVAMSTAKTASSAVENPAAS